MHKSYSIGKNSLHVLKGLDLHIKEGELWGRLDLENQPY